MVGTGIAAGRRRAAAAAAALTLLGIAAAAAALYWPVVFEALVLDREAVRGGQLWRLWSGHLVHLDVRHAAVNLVALAILAFAATRAGMLAALLRMSLWLMPGIGLGLLLCLPGLHWYAGLSGLLHGWLAWLLCRRGGTLGVVGLGLVLAKLVWEASSGPVLFDAFPVIDQAHGLGATGGLILALLQRFAAWCGSGNVPARRGRTAPLP